MTGALTILILVEMVLPPGYPQFSKKLFKDCPYSTYRIGRGLRVLSDILHIVGVSLILTSICAQDIIIQSSHLFRHLKEVSIVAQDLACQTSYRSANPSSTETPQSHSILQMLSTHAAGSWYKHSEFYQHHTTALYNFQYQRQASHLVAKKLVHPGEGYQVQNPPS